MVKSSFFGTPCPFLAVKLKKIPVLHNKFHTHSKNVVHKILQLLWLLYRMNKWSTTLKVFKK
jgi:hypothetical protein